VRRLAHGHGHLSHSQPRGSLLGQNPAELAEYRGFDPELGRGEDLAGLSLLGRVGKKNPSRFNGRTSKVCPTPRPRILR
jgi:hypothetical protein